MLGKESFDTWRLVVILWLRLIRSCFLTCGSRMILQYLRRCQFNSSSFLCRLFRLAVIPINTFHFLIRLKKLFKLINIFGLVSLSASQFPCLSWRSLSLSFFILELSSNFFLYHGSIWPVLMNISILTHHFNVLMRILSGLIEVFWIF